MTLSDDEQTPLFIDPLRNAQQLYSLALTKPPLWISLDKELAVFELMATLVTMRPPTDNESQLVMETTIKSIFTILIKEIMRIDKHYPTRIFWRWIESLMQLEDSYQGLYDEIIYSVKKTIKVSNPNYTLEQFAREEVFRTGLLRAKGIENSDYGTTLLGRASLILTTTTLLA